MRAAGIDVGRVRVGVAVADELGLLAHPRAPVDGRDPRRAVEALASLAAEEQIGTFVVGLPRPVGTTDDDDGVARFTRSGREVASDGATPLLELAEQAGLAPAAGCRMGICRTCSTRLEQGCVRDLRDGRLLESGQHVQVCVSAAVGDVALDL